MRSLLLSGTHLDDDAVCALAAAEWPRLQYMILNNNAITDRSADAFLDSTLWRRSGCELWLIGNPLSSATKAKLEVFGSRVSL
jgi:hypothetical protein